MNSDERQRAESFWSEPQSEAPPRRISRCQRDGQRELTQDEVVVPEGFGGYLGEVYRNQSYFLYRLGKSGWFGKALVIGLLLLYLRLFVFMLFGG